MRHWTTATTEWFHNIHMALSEYHGMPPVMVILKGKMMTKQWVTVIYGDTIFRHTNVYKVVTRGVS
jgi:hypothetical protein